MKSEDVHVCSRCDVECVPDEERYGWRCPCCRCLIRTAAMIAAEAERRAAERGVTPDVLYEEGKLLIRAEKPSDEEMARMVAFADRQAAEWEPACEHDTVNPWLPVAGD